MTAPAPGRRLAAFRAWFVVFAVLSLYLVWVVGVQYRVHLHEASFVLPNVAVLLGWWGVFVRTCVAWNRTTTHSPKLPAEEHHG